MNAADPSSLGLALEMIVKSFLVLAVALLLTWSMRRFSAAARHLCLVAAALSLLALPVASALLPSWPVLDLPNPFVSVRDPVSPSPGVTAAPEAGSIEEGGARAASPGAGPSPAVKAGGARWLSWLCLIWGGGAAVLLVRLIGGKIYGYRIVSRAPAVREERLLFAVQRMAERCGIARPPEVLESDHLKVPFVWGLLRPRLVLPPGAAKWPSERVEAVVRHELAHVKRRDLLFQFLAQVACCFYWINPLVWIMERKMFIERERACDDMAIGRESKASDYAGHLLQIVEELGATRNQVWVVSAMAEGTDFKDRIVSVLDPAAKRTAPKLGHTAAVAVVSALLVLSLSSLRPLSGATTAPEAAVRTADYDRGVVGSTGERRRAEPGDDSGVNGLIASLGVDDAGIREHAATVLGELGDTSAVPALIDALGDGDARVREHVASALGKIGDATAVPPLSQALLSDPDARVREHVASALGKVGKGDDGAYRALVEAFETDESVRVRAHAAFGLGLIGDRGALDLLVGGLDSPEAEIRLQCAEALGWLGDARALPHLKKVLDDSDERVRNRAQRSLQMLLEGR